MRKTHNAMLKFKVALAALCGQPMSSICKKYEVAESLVHKWKKQLKNDGHVLFSQSEKKKSESHEGEIAKLYQHIGRLTTENEFLKKVVEA